MERVSGIGLVLGSVAGSAITLTTFITHNFRALRHLNTNSRCALSIARIDHTGTQAAAASPRPHILPATFISSNKMYGALRLG